MIGGRDVNFGCASRGGGVDFQGRKLRVPTRRKNVRKDRIKNSWSAVHPIHARKGVCDC